MDYLVNNAGAPLTREPIPASDLDALTDDFWDKILRVNGIAPGFVNSNWECSFGDVETTAKSDVPLARVGQPAEYAEVIVFLCAGGSYITGEVIPVTGGLRL